MKYESMLHIVENKIQVKSYRCIKGIEKVLKYLRLVSWLSTLPDWKVCLLSILPDWKGCNLSIIQCGYNNRCNTCSNGWCAMPNLCVSPCWYGMLYVCAFDTICSRRCVSLCWHGTNCIYIISLSMNTLCNGCSSLLCCYASYGYHLYRRSP